MISICMAFYNRQALLDKTLESIHQSAVKDYELIIVDDASEIPLVCDEAKIIRVEKRDKWYTCSAVAFNRAFREATGDIIIIQNPECYHMGDVLSYVNANIKENTYLSFGCYAINNTETSAFINGVIPTISDYVFSGSTRNGWYNHTKYRPVGYHFCSAIMRKDLDRIGGFDERYAHGVAFDDDDLIRRIKCMGMNVKIINNPYVIHQYHTHFEFESAAAWKPFHAINQNIFQQGYSPQICMDYSRNIDYFPNDNTPWDIIKDNYNRYYLNYNDVRAPVIPKKLHMIWLGGEVPSKYTRLIDTWRNLHSDWEFKIWNDTDVQEFNMVNKIAYDKIENKGIKSTLFRYEILYRHGGLYADIDFECIKPFDDLLYLDFFGGGREKTPLLAEGLMACKPKDQFLEKIIDGITLKQDRISNKIENILRAVSWEYITDIYLEYIKTTTDKTVLFPDSFFYPMPNSLRYEMRDDTETSRIRAYTYLKPNTYCIHYWYTSWLPEPVPAPIRYNLTIPNRPKIHQTSPIAKRIGKIKYMKRRYGNRYSG